MNIEQTTDKLTRLLQAAGFMTVLAGVSESSDSRYLDVSIETGDEMQTWKVRISNHELPPTYANARPSDYEIGNNNLYAVALLDEWYLLAKILCDDHCLPYPPLLKRLLTISAAKRARLTEQHNNELRAAAAQATIDESEALAVYTANMKIINIQVNKIDSVSGQKRRQLRSRFNQQWRGLCNPKSLADIARRSVN